MCKTTFARTGQYRRGTQRTPNLRRKNASLISKFTVSSASGGELHVHSATLDPELSDSAYVCMPCRSSQKTLVSDDAAVAPESPLTTPQIVNPDRPLSFLFKVTKRQSGPSSMCLHTSLPVNSADQDLTAKETLRLLLRYSINDESECRALADENHSV